MFKFTHGIHLGGCCCGMVAALLVGKLRSAQDPISIAFFEKVSEFSLNGQLMIEILPPLSLLLSQLPENLLTLVDHGGHLLQGTVLARILSDLTRKGPKSRWNSICACLTLLLFGRSEAEEAYGGLDVGDSLGRSALLITFLCAMQNEPFSGGRGLLSVGTILIALLTCQNILFVFSIFTAYTTVGCKDLLERGHLLRVNPSKSISSFLFRAAWVTLATASVLVSVSVFIFPVSETSFSGNYNLCHLSASARREMRHGISPLAKRGHMQRENLEVTGPQFALHAGSIVSIYLPHAGFLWSDFHTWDEEFATFKPFVTPSSSIESTSRRVVFRDPLGRMKPWVFQRPVAAYSPSDTKTNIQNGDRIILRDAELDGFLAAEGRPSILDKLFFLTESPILRNEVSVQTIAGDSSLWIIYYDPASDSGFKLYNPEQDCYLSSSLRNFPDWDGSLNDTISAVLHMELEAACMTDPKDAVSRFFVVDGSFAQSLPHFSLGDDYCGGTLFHSAICKLHSNVKWTVRIYKSMLYLFAFKQKYPHWQDTPQYHVSPQRHLECVQINGYYLILLKAFALLTVTRHVFEKFVQKRLYCSPKESNTFVAVLAFTVTSALFRWLIQTEPLSSYGLLGCFLVGVGGVNETIEIFRIRKRALIDH